MTIKIKVNESYKDKLVKYLHNYDCACLTAFRKQIRNVTDNTKPEVVAFANDPAYLATWIDNNQRPCSPSNPTATQGLVPKTKNREWNNELRRTLLWWGYGVTKVHGRYREDGWDKAADEESLFVVNSTDDPKFIENIKMLGEAYNQDSVLIKEKGKDEAYIWGTNTADDPGYGEQKYIGKLVDAVPMDYIGPSTSIRNKAFTFKKDEDIEGSPLDLDYIGLHNNISKGLIRQDAQKLLKELGIITG